VGETSKIAPMPRRNGRFYGLGRLEALSDGIFAIALTLLVLELKLPESEVAARSLADILNDNWHSFLSWIISFIVLARLWMIQHDLLASAKRCSPRTILINFLFLSTISLVPFSAHLVGVYELSEPLALQIFALQLTLSAVSLGWLISSASKDNPGQELRRWSRQARHHLFIVPVIAVAGAILAGIAPVITMLIFGVESLLVLAALVFQPESEPDRSLAE
jgi:uncharacterized membrane protein